MNTLAEENYLKAIHWLEDRHGEGVSTNELAQKLNTKASSVTDMVKKLAEKKLVIYEKYKGVRLTPSGSKIALRIMRKHRLWEVFLVDKLKFKWHEVHEIAEQLEHVQSPELTSRLDAYLGFPRFDPHGDPIPDANGHVQSRSKVVVLANCKPGDSGVITGVNDSSDDFLQHLDNLGLVLGTEIKVLQCHSYDASVDLEFADKTKSSVTQRVAQNLFLQKNR